MTGTAGRSGSAWPGWTGTGAPVVMDLGPVMDVRDLIANKTAALVNRREMRDYIDVSAALDRYPRRGSC